VKIRGPCWRVPVVSALICATAGLLFVDAGASAGPGLRPHASLSLASHLQPRPISAHRDERACTPTLRLRGAGDAGDAEGAEGAVKEKELGTEAYNNKDFETALAHYQKASELDASAMVYRNNMAAAYFGMRKYQECIDTCKKAVEIGKENRADFKDLARAYARMGNALVKLDDLEGACQEFENSLMEHKDPQVALKAKNARHAITQKAAQNYLNPEQAEEHRQKGNAFFKEGKWVEAISEYSEGLKRDPENHLIYSNRGATYIKVMDMGSALRDCDKCIELKPEFPRAYARKATVEILCKQVHKAKETVEAGLKMSPDDAELKEVQRKVQLQVMGVGLTPEERELRAKEAMKDPNIVSIMQDPVMRQVLEDMQRDPSSAQKHMQDARVKANIEILMAAGIIQTG